MSVEIKVDAVTANQGIADMQSSASAIPEHFTRVIEGEDLESALEFNEIKQEVDELLAQSERIFHQHLLASCEAVKKYGEVDQQTANLIRMKS